MRSRMLLPLAALAAASCWCVLLLVVRKHAYGTYGHGYLVWNLGLAWLPLAFALLLLRAARRRAPLVELVALGAGWLAFLPNAPYVVTDFVHLGERHRLYDAVVIASFSFTALALGFASLMLVQLVVTRLAGAAFGWGVALAALFLSSVGVYLGRVNRLNSWDLLVRPRLVAGLIRDRLDDPFGNRFLIGFVLAVCGFLTVAYLVLYGLAATVESAWPSRLNSSNRS
jgi:uncharacterized membrane protein